MNWYQNIQAFTKTVFNRRPAQAETEVVFSNNRQLSQLIDIVSADAGLITASGKSKLEEQHGLAVFEEMSRDSQIKAALSVKKYAILSGQWEVRPYDDSPAAIEQAEFLKWNLQELLGDRGLGLEPIMTSFAYGRSICEKVYRPVKKGKWAGKLMLKRLAPKNPGFVEFKQDDFGNLTDIHFASQAGVMKSVPIDKVVHYAWDTEFDNPYGRSDLTSCYAWFWAKKTMYKYGLIFGDKFASPIPLVHVEKGLTTQQQNDLETALINFHMSNFLKLPKGVEVELAQSSGTGGDYYMRFMQHCNGEMARAILAQSLTINENQKTGTHAQAKIHKETLQYILDKVQNDLERTVILEQIIKPLIDMNFPEVEAYPKFQFATYDIDFLATLADVINTLCNVVDTNGNRLVEPTEDWVRERLNLPKRNEKDFPLRTEPLELQLNEQNHKNQLELTKQKGGQSAESSTKSAKK